MTRDETKTIIRIIQNSFPNFKIEKPSEMVDVWAMMLEDEDYRVISKALMSYVKTNTSGFAPSIGQLVDIARQVTTPEMLTAEEAWSMVYKAICNGIYGAVKEYEKLPEAARVAVGDPHQLTVWATDDHFNEGVVRTQFMDAYKTASAKQMEKVKLPADVRQMTEAVNRGGEREKFKNQISKVTNNRLAIETTAAVFGERGQGEFEDYLKQFK